MLYNNLGGCRAIEDGLALPCRKGVAFMVHILKIIVSVILFLIVFTIKAQ
nr:MAG TPA: hypothetical protein [Caudoviricetes sp.]